MNNIYNVDKISLEYLINPDILDKHTKRSLKQGKKIKEEFENDTIFYRKRVIGIIKEMIKGNYKNEYLKENFENYLRTLIVYFKETDSKDLLQEYYLDFSFNLSNINEKLDTIKENEEVDEYLYNKDKLEVPTINKFVKIKKKSKDEYHFPEKRDINLKDPKLRKKGLIEKEKYNNNINENKKERNK